MAGGIDAWNGLVAGGAYEAGLAYFSGASGPEELISLSFALEAGNRIFYERVSHDVKEEKAASIFRSMGQAEERHKGKVAEAMATLKGFAASAGKVTAKACVMFGPEDFDKMKPGDLAFIYHSSTDPVGIVGIAEIVKGGYPDPSAFDPKDSHFDPKSRRESPTWFMVDVKAVGRIETRTSTSRPPPRWILRRRRGVATRSRTCGARRKRRTGLSACPTACPSRSNRSVIKCARPFSSSKRQGDMTMPEALREQKAVKHRQPDKQVMLIQLVNTI